MSSKKSSHSAQEYEAIYNDLKRFYSFKFKIKKSGFRPHEKTLLTKLDKKFSVYSDGEAQGTYAFAPATKSQVRSLRKSMPDTGFSVSRRDGEYFVKGVHGDLIRGPFETRKEAKEIVDALSKKYGRPKNKMVITNKGVFVPQGKTKSKGVDYTQAKPHVIGKGKNVRIVIDAKTRSEIFVPRLPGESILEMYERVKSSFPNIYRIFLDVGHHKARSTFSSANFEDYLDELNTIDNNIAAKGYDNEEVFTGLWLITQKPHPDFED